MRGIVNRLLARLLTASVRVVGIVIPVAVDGAVLVGGVGIGRTPGEQRARSHKAPCRSFRLRARTHDCQDLGRRRLGTPQGRALVAVGRRDDAAGHEGTDVAGRRGGRASRRAWRKTVALEIPSSRAIAAFDRMPQSLRSLVMRLAGQSGRRPERRRLRA